MQFPETNQFFSGFCCVFLINLQIHLVLLCFKIWMLKEKKRLKIRCPKEQTYQDASVDLSLSPGAVLPCFLFLLLSCSLSSIQASISKKYSPIFFVIALKMACPHTHICSKRFLARSFSNYVSAFWLFILRHTVSKYQIPL